jgi:hypothetical protein
MVKHTRNEKDCPQIDDLDAGILVNCTRRNYPPFIFNYILPNKWNDLISGFISVFPVTI